MRQRRVRVSENLILRSNFEEIRSIMMNVVIIVSLFRAGIIRSYGPDAMDACTMCATEKGRACSIARWRGWRPLSRWKPAREASCTEMVTFLSLDSAAQSNGCGSPGLLLTVRDSPYPRLC